VSIWNRYALTSRFAAGVGVLYRSDVFASTDNRARLPKWARVDAAAYYDLDDRWRLQVNVENLTDVRYFASAHNNANITPGSPRAVRTALTWRY
jgi:catecholate siderophore receptor